MTHGLRAYAREECCCEVCAAAYAIFTEVLDRAAAEVAVAFNERLSTLPLRSYLDVNAIPVKTAGKRYGERYGYKEGARIVGRHLAGPTLSEDAADRIACALGTHPSRIWPNWFDLGETA